MIPFAELYPGLIKYVPDWLETFYPSIARFARGDGYPCGNKGVFIPRRNKCWTHPKTGQKLKKPLTYQMYKTAKEKSQRSRTEKGRTALDNREQGFRDKARERVKGWQNDKSKEKQLKQVNTQEKSIPKPKLIGRGSHHDTPRTALEYHEAMANTGNEITLEEAERRIAAVKDWTGGGYIYIRRGQQEGQPGDDARRINDFVKSITPYKGEIYRGINVPNIDHFLLEVKQNHGVLEQDAHSSWSSSKKVAEEFAHNNSYRKHPVLIHSVSNKTGASIRRLSKQIPEDEVLVPVGARYKVKNTRKEDDILVLDVEEV